MSNQASVTRSVPVAAAHAPTHGERRHAAKAVSRKATARPASNPDQARSQCSVSWCGRSDVESQIVHGSMPTPIAVNTTTTHRRSVSGRNLMACLHCRK